MGLKVNVDESRDFEPVVEMIQPAVLADIVDKGLIPSKFKPGTTQHKCMFVWIVSEEDSEGRNKRVFETFTLSLNEKASLRKRLKDFGVNDKSIEESKATGGIELDSFVGTKRMLVLSEEDGENGKKFLKVTATMALKKGQTAPVVPADFKRKEAK